MCSSICIFVSKETFLCFIELSLYLWLFNRSFVQCFSTPLNVISVRLSPESIQLPRAPPLFTFTLLFYFQLSLCVWEAMLVLCNPAHFSSLAQCLESLGDWPALTSSEHRQGVLRIPWQRCERGWGPIEASSLPFEPAADLQIMFL